MLCVTINLSRFVAEFNRIAISIPVFSHHGLLEPGNGSFAPFLRATILKQSECVYYRYIIFNDGHIEGNDEIFELQE